MSYNFLFLENPIFDLEIWGEFCRFGVAFVLFLGKVVLGNLREMSNGAGATPAACHFKKNETENFVIS
ncbi:hypothetical protein [Hugenholtzia roseola]|uniref:hypothetical protein n=1 Tax=Hugenholtzia roseola TaxID=1002 RepID=UPI0004025884|nr:hypothetical protein [Hugenholtzia roseola]